MDGMKPPQSADLQQIVQEMREIARSTGDEWVPVGCASGYRLKLWADRLAALSRSLATAEIKQLVEKWKRQTEHNRKEQQEAQRHGVESGSSMAAVAASILGYRIEVRERCTSELDAILKARSLPTTQEEPTT